MITATSLFAAGFTDVIPVIPPTATLAPSSRIPTEALGKVPGRKGTSGLWAGFDWLKHPTTMEDARQWELDGANIGIRTAHFPAIDIDCSELSLVAAITRIAEWTLGPAPVRIGNAPKSLLLYRTEQPFRRMRLWIQDGDKAEHLIECLGDGQQFVAAGIHPKTQRGYAWSTAPVAAELKHITREDVQTFFDAVAAELDMLGYTVKQEGVGGMGDRSKVEQEHLKAPSIAELERVVPLIPNTNESHPGRVDYLRMGHAIRAAAQDDLEVGFALFLEWAMKWEGNTRAPEGNDPDFVRADWRRMKGPYEVGFPYLAELARPFGYNDASLEFDAAPPTHRDDVLRALRHSEQDLADTFLAEHRQLVRSVPAWGSFIVWDGRRWERDGMRLAEALAADTLRKVADQVLREGATDKEKAFALKRAEQLLTSAKISNVLKIVSADRSLVIDPALMDADINKLNTPNGIWDLTTFAVEPHHPDALFTKMTSVPADAHGDCPRWKTFLDEAMAGDIEKQMFLQRLCGYCLTGSVEEHAIIFAWGTGGNGKGRFVTTLIEILGDYARTAPMDMFYASVGDKHPTDLASLMGARLAAAEETLEGKRWNEARLKQLSGGDRVTARFMHKDFFTYQPQFKLVMAGNNKPQLRSVDEAMRRRFHLVPFTTKPKVKDLQLQVKLRQEYPAILAWMIEGCRMWRAEGLNPPASILEATNEYFEEEDALGRWMAEACTADAQSSVSVRDLFQSWTEWCRTTGEFVGTSMRLSKMLQNHGLERVRMGRGGDRGYRGLALRPATEFSHVGGV